MAKQPRLTCDKCGTSFLHYPKSEGDGSKCPWCKHGTLRLANKQLKEARNGK